MPIGGRALRASEPTLQRDLIIMTNITTDVTDMVHELLSRNVTEVFKTVLALDVASVPPTKLHLANKELVAGSVGFVGDANGIAYFKVTAAFARTLTCRMIGLTEAELDEDEMVNDVVGELTNMIVGNVKSSLCDAGFDSVLTIPSVVRGCNLKVAISAASEHDLLSFRCGEDYIAIELLMKTDS